MAVLRAWSSVVTAGESPPWTQNIWLSMHAAKLQPAQCARQGASSCPFWNHEPFGKLNECWAFQHSLQDRLIVCWLLIVFAHTWLDDQACH